MKSRTLMVICPSPRDATSLYRGIGPIAKLRNSREDLRIQFTDSVDWTSCAMSDGVFLQRPFTDKHVQMLEVARLNRKPTWIDYDDDLFHVTHDNPTWEVYGRKEIKQNIAKCMSLADYVTYSTRPLRQSMEEEFLNRIKQNLPKGMVVPNAFDQQLYPREPRIQDREKLIVWRGSNTHVRDLLAYSEEIVKLSHKYPDWTWLFIGMYPWTLADHMPEGRLLHKSAIDPVHYMGLLHELRPNIMFAPLWDSQFNKGKSNISWLEGSYAGAACVVPNWTGWKNPGATTYEMAGNSFFNSMEFLMTQSEEFRRQMVSQSWNYIEQELTLAKANKIRSMIIDDMWTKVP